MKAPALEARGLKRNFGALIATNDVSFEIAPGARQALIGPNGAGKTTLINLLTGVIKPTTGQVFLQGRDVTVLSSSPKKILPFTDQAIVLDRGAIAHAAPSAKLLAEPSALDAPRGCGWACRAHSRSIAGRVPATRQKSAPEPSEIEELLTRFGLEADLDQPTRKLPYGKQRLLEIALALATRPRVLLLDEPAAGVPEEERQDILAALAALPSDVAILLI